MCQCRQRVVITPDDWEMGCVLIGGERWPWLHTSARCGRAWFAERAADFAGPPRADALLITSHVYVQSPWPKRDQCDFKTNEDGHPRLCGEARAHHAFAPVAPGAQCVEVNPWRDEMWETHTRVTPEVPGSDGDLRYLALGFAGEAGELANLIKKEWRVKGSVPREKIQEEFGDSRAYLWLIGRLLGFDEEQVMVNVIIPKTRQRWPK